MKNTDRLIISATAIYSYLFYNQNAGINFLLLSLVFIILLLCRNKNLLQRKEWIMSAAITLISGVSILFHSSALAIIANVSGLLLLSAYSFSKRNSSIFSFLFSCYSVATSVIHFILDVSQRNLESTNETKRDQKHYKFFTFFIVFLLCIVFLVLYRNSNPLFKANTQWINFDFISFSWVVFTVSGFFIVYGLFYHRTISKVETWENSLPLKNGVGEPSLNSRYQTEVSSGVLLFFFLNLMLVILNVGDISTIWFNGALPKNINHSDFVHNGVSLIILSIVIATSLIMFLYRADFSSIAKSTTLKIMVYVWILQNIIMLISTASRNQIYIQDYNLTYKRIGVYVWLVLAALGLLITFFKVWKNQSNWFLIKSNFTLWFCFLALSSAINWDLLITRYNLTNKPITEVDFHYLFSLSDSNIPELLEVTKREDFHLINGLLKSYTDPHKNSYSNRSYKWFMKMKIKLYLNDYKSDWQSWDLRDKRIMNHLIK